MEEKIFLILAEITQILHSVNNRLDNMDQRLDNIDNRLDNTDRRLDAMDQKLETVDNRLDNLTEDNSKLHCQMADLRQQVDQILERQLVFEDEYGTKIDAIFDYVQFHQKINMQRFDKINDLEKRVSALERKNA